MSQTEERQVIVPPTIASPEALHLFLQQQLDFPAYYGQNLDALWDCATADIALPVCLIWPREWRGQSHFSESFFDVLNEAADENWLLRIEVAK